MATGSARTIRIRGIDENFTLEDVTDLYARWNEVVEERSISSFFSRLLPSRPSSMSTCLGASLAIQNGYKVATASFNDQSFKARAVTKNQYPPGWEIDDSFDGITILHSPTAERDVEIEYNPLLIRNTHMLI